MGGFIGAMQLSFIYAILNSSINKRTLKGAATTDNAVSLTMAVAGFSPRSSFFP